MISHEYRCIFIHQRKCAGNAIIQSFGYTAQDAEWHTFNDGVLSKGLHGRPSDYAVFCVVRNPWDRFISGWKYCEGTKNRSMKEVLNNLPQTGHDYRHITRLQTSLIHNEKGALVVNHILRFENLQNDFDKFCDAISKPRSTLSRLNEGSHLPYRDYYDPESIELARRHFKVDIETFGYPF